MKTAIEQVKGGKGRTAVALGELLPGFFGDSGMVLVTRLAEMSITPTKPHGNLRQWAPSCIGAIGDNITKKYLTAELAFPRPKKSTVSRGHVRSSGI